jgi:RND family efflux transporter MFP subunit
MRLYVFLSVLASFSMAVQAQTNWLSQQSQGDLSSTPARNNTGMEYECLVEPSMVVNVGSPLDGVLEQVMVTRGDRVRKGQVVAKLRSNVQQAAVELSKAHVEFGRRRAKRNSELFAQELITAQEHDELQTEVRLRELELRKDNELLKLRTITSPVNGVVVKRHLQPGEFIRADKSDVLTLAQIDPLNVEVIAPASLFGKIEVGMSGKVSMSQYVAGTFEAEVVVVDKVIDAASRTFGIRLQLPNEDNKIPAGVDCTVLFGN